MCKHVLKNDFFVYRLNQSNPVNLVDSTSIMDLMNGVLPNSKQVVTETVVMALLDKSHHTGKNLYIFV